MPSPFIDRNQAANPTLGTSRWAKAADVETSSAVWGNLIDYEDAAPALLIGEYQTGKNASTCQIGDKDVFDEYSYRVDENAALFWKDDRHLVTIAGSRADKGVAAIIPNVALYGGSILVNDPKGEVASLVAERRGKGNDAISGLGQNVAVLDPYGIAHVSDSCRSGFNPLDLLGGHNKHSVADAGEIAATLSHGELSGASRHFDERARALIEGLILHCVSTEPPKRRNLVTVYEYVTIGIRPPEEARDSNSQKLPDPFEWLLRLMCGNPAFGGAVEAAARILSKLGSDEFGGVISTADRMLSFLKYEGPRELFARSMSFELSALKTDPKGCSVFICLPVSRLSTHAAMVRMLIQQTITIMERTKGQPKTGLPVLMVLDEFATLGHMRVIEDAAGYMAGFGVKLWAILQDLSQLKSLYQDRWETFLNNAGAVVAWANADLTTQEYLSRRLGQTELRRLSYSSNTGESISNTAQGNPSSPTKRQRPLATGHSSSANDGVGTSENFQLAPLLNPDEIGIIFNRESERMLVLINGCHPLVLRRVRYYERFEFVGKVDQSEEFPRLTTSWKEARAFREAQIEQRARPRQEPARLAGLRAWVAKHIGR